MVQGGDSMDQSMLQGSSDGGIVESEMERGE